MQPITQVPIQIKSSHTPYDRNAVKAILASRGGSNQSVRIFEENEIFNALKAKVKGQDMACRVIDEVYSVGALRKTKREPIGAVLLAGPPGTGKSYIIECLHQFLTGESGLKGMIYIDCGKLKNVEQASNELFGMSKGYVGADEGGVIPRGIQKRPTAVILFDEFEKACPQVQETLLVALNSGFVEDKYTKQKVPCGETFWAFTTNKNQQQLAPLFEKESDLVKRAKLLRDNYISSGWLSPEFANRLSDFLWLDKLGDDDKIDMIGGMILTATMEIDSNIVINKIDPGAIVWLFDALERIEGTSRDLKRQVCRTVSRDILGLIRQKIVVTSIDVVCEGDTIRAIPSIGS